MPCLYIPYMKQTKSRVRQKKQGPEWNGRRGEQHPYIKQFKPQIVFLQAPSLRANGRFSEKVNFKWPSRLGQSGIQAQCSSAWPLCRPTLAHFKARGVGDGGCGGGIACVKNLVPSTKGLHSWPRRSWLNTAGLRSPLSSQNQDSNLMLPPLNKCQGETAE